MIAAIRAGPVSALQLLSSRAPSERAGAALADVNDLTAEEWIAEARRGGPQRQSIEAFMRDRQFGIDLVAAANELREDSEKAEAGANQEKIFRRYADLL